MVSDFGLDQLLTSEPVPDYPATHLEACLLDHICVVHIDFIRYQHRHDAGDFSGDFMEIAGYGGV